MLSTWSWLLLFEWYRERKISWWNSCAALGEIKKPPDVITVHSTSCVWLMNKMEGIQIDFSLNTEGSSAPLPLLVFSCQCQRSGSLNGPDGYRTHSSPSLSPFSSPSCPPLQFFLAPPPPTNTSPSFFCIPAHSSICSCTLMSLMALWQRRHSVAQGSAVKPFLSSSSQTWWLCISCIVSLGKERNVCRKDPLLPGSSSASSSSSWSLKQPVTFAFLRNKEGNQRNYERAKINKHVLVLSLSSLSVCSVTCGEIYWKYSCFVWVLVWWQHIIFQVSALCQGWSTLLWSRCPLTSTTRWCHAEDGTKRNTAVDQRTSSALSEV